jgi:N utilization substance protein A
LIANALKPAEVAEVSLCFELGRATVVVREDQLSLAIGKRGQNVRLAARLTGWDVDILTQEEFTKGVETMYQTIQSVEGITEQMADKLAALGMVSVFDIEEVGVDVLTSELEISEEIASKVVEACSVKAKVVAEQQQKDKEEKERKAREAAEVGAKLLEGDAPATDAPAGGAAGEAGEAAADAILGGGQ